MVLTEKCIDLIEPVIDHSLSILHVRTDGADIACGLLAALKRLRAELEELGGYHTVAILDGAIRDRLAVRCARSGGSDAVIPLDRLRATGLGETVMLATVESCLVYANQETDLGGMMRIITVLLDRLLQTLGGPPEYSALLAVLSDGDHAHTGESGGEADGSAAALH
jgi:hypothetical protein